MPLAPWDLIGTEIAFLVFAVLLCVVAVVIVALGMLGVPFWRLSERLHPRLQDAQRRGQERRARRLEVAQTVLDHTGDVVVGFATLAVVSAAVVVLFGVAVLAIGVAALVVLGLLGFAAERLGLIDPSL